MKCLRSMMLAVVILAQASQARAKAVDQVPPVSYQFENVHYVANHDGDTIKVTIDDVHPLLGTRVEVRVRGIDAPEMTGKGPCEWLVAEIARDFVTSRLRTAAHIDLFNVGRDKYFRLLADVKYDGQDLAEAILAHRFAVRYDGAKKPVVQWCDSLRAPEDQKAKGPPTSFDGMQFDPDHVSVPESFL